MIRTPGPALAPARVTGVTGPSGVSLALADRDDPSTLYRTWWPVVVDFAARKLGNLEEGEVVAQEALLRALDLAQREPVGSFAALVLRIAHNLAVDRVRRRDWRAERADPNDLVARIGPETVDLARVRRAVDRLPADLREVIELRYTDGRSFAEIAEHLGLSKNGVFARHHRALELLREALSTPRTPARRRS